jgi:ABC-type Fe3+ transport system permease subunit
MRVLQEEKMNAIMLVIGVGTLAWNIYATVKNGKNGFHGAVVLGIVLILIGIFSLAF